MNILSNQKGYTLLLTLLLVVIISGFIGTLTFFTITQQKQVEITDEQFLLSDITDMGVEYYRAQVINIFIEEVTKVQKDVSELENNLEFENKANEIEQTGLNSIQDRISGLTVNPPEITDVIKYQLDSVPTIADIGKNLLVSLYISGVVNSKTEQYKLSFKLPNNILDITITHGGSDEENSGKFVPTPDFANTIPTPFPPVENELCPTKKNDWTSGIICNTSIPFDIDYLDNSTVYLDNNANFSNGNNNNYGTSTLYVNGNLDMKNLNSNGNISFYINGEADFDNLNNAQNVLIQGTKNATFNNLNNISSLSVLLNGSGTFHNIGGTDFILYTSGSASFGAINNLKDSRFEVQGNTTFNHNSNFQNLKSHHVGTANAQQIQLEESIMIFESSLSQNGAFQVKNNSKVCIRSTSTLGMLDIDSTSKFYINESSEVTYSLQGGSSSPIKLPSNQFEELCSLGSSESPTYEVKVDDSIDLELIQNEIEYEIQ